MFAFPSRALAEKVSGSCSERHRIANRFLTDVQLMDSTFTGARMIRRPKSVGKSDARDLAP